METYNNGVATELQNSALQLDMKTCFMEKKIIYVKKQHNIFLYYCFFPPMCRLCDSPKERMSNVYKNVHSS